MMFATFFDDAATFPPGSMAMTEAVRAHLARRTTADAKYVGPFVCSVDRLHELAQALGDERVDVAVVGLPTGPLPPGAELVAVELRGPVEAAPNVPEGVRLFVEQSWGSTFEVPEGAFLKLRCGGEQIPSACQLAMAIEQCVQDDQPFKLTAGLHHAMRTEHEHGLLNVLAAVDAALRGADPVPMLLLDDPQRIVVERPEDVRRLFLSVGTCSIDEPLSGLRALGWVA